jgi:alpha-amylase
VPSDTFLSIKSWGYCCAVRELPGYKAIPKPHQKYHDGISRLHQLGRSLIAPLNMLFLQFIVAYFLYLISFVSAADTNAWKSRSIYFVLTDRVARSSSDTGGSACGDLGNYCGGTFKGLESKLDYIQNLGFDSIWITPVVASKSLSVTSFPVLTSTTDSAGGYHGYWAQDLYSINSNYGTASDLKSLVSTAHSKVFVLARY